MSIIISGAGSNPALPLDMAYADQILASSALVDWFDTDHYTLSSGALVATMTSRKSGSTRTLSQATAAKQATLTPNAIGGVSGVGGYGEFTFSDAQVYALSSNPDLSQPYTWVIIYRATVAETGNIFGNQSSGNQRSAFLMTSGSPNFGHGNRTLTGIHIAGSYNFAVMGSDGSTVSLAINGGMAITGSTDNNVTSNAIVLGASNGSLGNPWTGGVADVIMLAGSPSNNTILIEVIKQYAHAAYNLTIA